MSASDLYFHPAGPVPPRVSSAGMGDSAGFPGKPVKADLLPASAESARRHTRNRSSVDGTKYKDGQWYLENERILLGPYDYLLQHPGKDIRRQLINGFDAWLQVPPESLSVITKVVAMLHTSSLLIDDVEDSSALRRGIPAAHSIYGTAQTINCGNYVYFLALQELQKLNNPATIEIYTQEMMNLHRGQGMEIFWRDTLTCPSEEEYLEMVGNKTGGLFRLAVKLMQTESKTGKDCVSLVNVMGLIFQICDDYQNLAESTYTQKKGLCEDLTEGKFSFPIIHSIRSKPHNHQLLSILKQRTDVEEVKMYAISYMEGTGSFEYTQKVVRELRDKAVALIDQIDNSGGGKQAEGHNGDKIRVILEKITSNTLKPYNSPGH